VLCSWQVKNVCPREHLTKLSFQHFDKLNIIASKQKIPKELHKLKEEASRSVAIGEWGKVSH